MKNRIDYEMILPSIVIFIGWLQFLLLWWYCYSDIGESFFSLAYFKIVFSSFWSSISFIWLFVSGMCVLNVILDIFEINMSSLEDKY